MTINARTENIHSQRQVNPRERYPYIRIGETTAYVTTLRLTVKAMKRDGRAGIDRLPVTACHAHQLKEDQKLLLPETCNKHVSAWRKPETRLYDSYQNVTYSSRRS